MPDGTTQFPYSLYSELVEDWKDAFFELELQDRNVYKNMEKIKAKPIIELTRDEILTRMTYLIQAERFWFGLIEKAMNDGTLEALSLRLHEITK